MTEDIDGNDSSNSNKAEPEVLERLEGERDGEGIQTLVALVSQYTERPDLFLSEIEKHDPGFIARMNKAVEEHATQFRAGRYKFGQFQAYASLIVAVLAALIVLGTIIYAVSLGAGFFTILALVICYAVTQGGSRGFGRIVDGLVNLIAKFRDKKPNAEE